MARRSAAVEYLECREGTSSKFYAAVNLDRLGIGDPDSKGVFVYGPIGRIQSCTIQAGNAVDGKIREKLKKGYKPAANIPDDVRVAIREKAIEALRPEALVGMRMSFQQSDEGNWLLVLSGVAPVSAEPPKPRDMSWADNW